jgi:cytochrome oxidase assembly protein ShyY1
MKIFCQAMTDTRTARDSAQSKPTLVKSGTFWFGSLLALVGVVAFTALGFWQWGRAEWKTRLLAEHAAAQSAQPLPLADALDRIAVRPAGEVSAPIRVVMRGFFDAARTVLLDNQRRGADVGVLVFTRFVPAGSDAAILVNRGWLPLGADRRPSGSLDPPPGEVQLGGLLRPPPATGIRLGDAPPLDPIDGPPLLPWLDLAELGRAWRESLPPVVLELDPESPGGFRRDADPLPNTLPPAQHRGYAVQWWGLATAVAAIWLALVLRARRRDGRSTGAR